MILTVVILLVVLLALGLLFVPIQIFIDTDTGKYYAGLGGLPKASFESDEKELLRVRLKVLFYEHCFYPVTKSIKPRPNQVLVNPFSNGTIFKNLCSITIWPVDIIILRKFKFVVDDMQPFFG